MSELEQTGATKPVFPVEAVVVQRQDSHVEGDPTTVRCVGHCVVTAQVSIKPHHEMWRKHNQIYNISSTSGPAHTPSPRGRSPLYQAETPSRGSLSGGRTWEGSTSLSLPEGGGSPHRSACIPPAGQTEAPRERSAAFDKPPWLVRRCMTTRLILSMNLRTAPYWQWRPPWQSSSGCGRMSPDVPSARP